MSRPLAKSLHTITAIVQVARFAQSQRQCVTYPEAIKRALSILGLEGQPDPHGLAAAAEARLKAEDRAAFDATRKGAAA